MGKKKLMLGDGVIYEGDIVNGKPNGKGKAIYYSETGSSSIIHDGDWVDGIPKEEAAGWVDYGFTDPANTNR